MWINPMLGWTREKHDLHTAESTATTRGHRIMSLVRHTCGQRVRVARLWMLLFLEIVSSYGVGGSWGILEPSKKMGKAPQFSRAPGNRSDPPGPPGFPKGGMVRQSTPVFQSSRPGTAQTQRIRVGHHESLPKLSLLDVSVIGSFFYLRGSLEGVISEFRIATEWP